MNARAFIREIRTMNFETRTLLRLSPLLLLVACGGQNDQGQSQGENNGGATSSVCANSCYDNCVTCEKKTGAQCAIECASSGGTGGTTSTGGATTSTGGTTTSTGGTTTSTGGTTTSTGGTGGSGGTTGTGGTTGVTTKSVSVSTDFFTVDAGGEIYVCQDFANPFGKDIDIITSESFMTAGSHHMFAFRMQGLTNGALGPCPNGGLEFHDYVHSAQTPQELTSYPPGIGRFLPATDGLRIMAHYLNPNSTPITNAQVTLRLDYVDSNQVTAHAAGIFLNDVGITVPPGTSAQSQTYSMPYDINILGGASHMHMRGVGFHASSGNAVLYDIPNPTAGAWDEPIPNSFSPALAVPGGSTITVTCDYNNTTSTTFTFGESASTNEMCIYSGTYYPAPNGVSIALCPPFGNCPGL